MNMHIFKTYLPSTCHMLDYARCQWTDGPWPQENAGKRGRAEGRGKLLLRRWVQDAQRGASTPLLVLVAGESWNPRKSGGQMKRGERRRRMFPTQGGARADLDSREAQVFPPGREARRRAWAWACLGRLELRPLCKAQSPKVKRGTEPPARQSGERRLVFGGRKRKFPWKVPVLGLDLALKWHYLHERTWVLLPIPLGSRQREMQNNSEGVLPEPGSRWSLTAADELTCENSTMFGDQSTMARVSRPTKSRTRPCRLKAMEQQSEYI